MEMGEDENANVNEKMMKRLEAASVDGVISA